MSGASLFAAAADDLSSAVDDTFGELLRIVPKVQNAYRAADADPSRQPFTVRGTFTDGAGRRETALAAGAVGRSFERSNAYAIVQASFDVRLLQGNVIAEQDIVVRTEILGEPEYEVIKIDPDGDSRIVAKLSRAVQS